MTIEEKCNKVILKYKKILNAENICTWDFRIQQPVSTFSNKQLKKWLNEIYIYNHIPFLQMFLDIDNIIYDSDQVEGLTSTSLYIRTCKRWFMKNNYSKNRTTKRIQMLIKIIELKQNIRECHNIGEYHWIETILSAVGGAALTLIILIIFNYLGIKPL